jgi:predicted nucleic acid-binding protein
VSKPVYVLDSYAVLAYLNGEPGMRRVIEVLSAAQNGAAEAVLCTLNLGEVLYTVERRRGLAKAQQALALIESLPLRLVEAGRELVLEAAHIKARHAISYADAFAAALAHRENGIVLTGDPEFKSVEDQVTVEWLASQD